MNMKRRNPTQPPHLTVDNVIDLQKRIRHDCETKARDYFIPMIEQRIRAMVLVYRQNECAFDVPQHTLGLSPYSADKVAKKLRKHFRKTGFRAEGKESFILIKWPRISQTGEEEEERYKDEGTKKKTKKKDT
jgi:hypothetical protein